MNFKWVGPVALLAALVIGDQIRIHRPGHKYRLSVEVQTPEGVKSASGVMAVHPYRGYSGGGMTQTKGDAIFVDLGGGKNLVALLAHAGDKGLELDGMNYVALRAFNAAGVKVPFIAMNKVTGVVPVKAPLIPILVTFTDINDPATAREVPASDLAAALGKGFGLQGVSVEVVSNGLWPLDLGGSLGEPVTRGIEAKLPWLNGTGNPAKALEAAGLKAGEAIDISEAFTRK